MPESSKDHIHDSIEAKKWVPQNAWLDKENNINLNMNSEANDTNASPSQEESKPPVIPPYSPMWTILVDSPLPTIVSSKSSSLKVRNSTNTQSKHSNIGKSIECLCDSIKKPYDAIFSSPHHAGASDGMSQFCDISICSELNLDNDWMIDAINK